MKLAIITGISRGLGEAIATLFMKKGIHVIGISRKEFDLHNEAKTYGVEYLDIACDLGNISEVDKLCAQISQKFTDLQPEACYLVNNAAILEPIDQAMNIESKDIFHHIQVNTVAPIVLMNDCLQKAHEQNISFTGVMITSGAAERPVYGWSAYCSTKASINMYTKTVALEQEQLNTGNKVFAFSPGVMDTNMQKVIRSRTKEQFRDVETFRKYKEDGMLRDPIRVGEVLVNLMINNDKIRNGNIYHVSDYL